jgi:hypothetical protein
MDKLSAEVQKLAAQWLKWDPNPDTKKEIQDLVDKSDEAELKKRLVNRISFGTAGNFLSFMLFSIFHIINRIHLFYLFRLARGDESRICLHE